jgi:hypothetical protein
MFFLVALAASTKDASGSTAGVNMCEPGKPVVVSGCKVSVQLTGSLLLIQQDQQELVHVKRRSGWFGGLERRPWCYAPEARRA